jgi:hypothetical protein
MKAQIWLSDPTIALEHTQICWTGAEWVVRNLEQGNPARLISSSGFEQTIEGEMHLAGGILRIAAATLALSGREV